jgi:hypothetical protein
MKSILTALCTTALLVILTFNTFAQTQQTRPVSGFKGISAGTSCSVHVKIDGTESLKIVADESVINDYTTVVEDGILNIRQKNRFSLSLFSRTFNHRVDIYITAKALSSLTSSGSGNIQLDGNLTGNAELKASGSGHITAAVNASSLNTSVSGSGGIVSTVNANQLNASVSGSGSITLNGAVKNADVKVSGSGNMKAKELKADAVNASVSGSGNISINADKKIIAHVSGSGNITYLGNATDINVSSSGSGKVRKA